MDRVFCWIPGGMGICSHRVVALGDGGQAVVGRGGHRGGHIARPVDLCTRHDGRGAKRLIGRRIDDPETQRIRSQVGWGVFEGESGDARIRAQGKDLHSPRN